MSAAVAAIQVRRILVWSSPMKLTMPQSPRFRGREAVDNRAPDVKLHISRRSRRDSGGA